MKIHLCFFIIYLAFANSLTIKKEKFLNLKSEEKLNTQFESEIDKNSCKPVYIISSVNGYGIKTSGNRGHQVIIL